MTEYSGFLVVVDETQRAAAVRETIERDFHFSDVVSTADWHPKEYEIALLAIGDRSFSYACLCRRGAEVATAKCRVNFLEFVSLGDVPFKEIEGRIGTRLTQYFTRASSGSGGRVPQATWQAVWKAIEELRPALKEALQRLRQLRQQAHVSRRGGPYDIIAEEKDAFSLAAQVFGVDAKQAMTSWAPPEDGQPAPFFRGLTKANVREDTMIINDQRSFGDWIPQREFLVGSAIQFTKSGRTLTVLNANRTTLEKSLGVDLIYYHHNYNSFVMVQYKRMTNGEDSKAEYRPVSDASYQQEIDRMHEVMAQLDQSKAVDVAGYRLNPMPFYFKFCPSIVLEPLSSGCSGPATVVREL